ncbi:anti-sigma factor family protein [Paenibacillus sepulcri]|uniref:Anti-sigma-W factor RsiW n=1 Tax=Paenibacillus sepulcri TaxID=359917 RepID=A0ABS7BVW4_9BACL|nr:zf-HC2 domain-containing protein [Paenibacillus sepulcri]
MTDHPKAQLSAYLDDELNDEERQQVETHLATCESCQVLLEDLLSIQGDVVKTFQLIQEPADLEIRVLQSIGIEKMPAAAGKGWLYVPLVALLAFGAIWFATGPIFVKLIVGFIKFMMVMVYLASHFISSVPVLSGLTVVLSLIVLTASVYSLRRLFQTTTD